MKENGEMAPCTEHYEAMNDTCRIKKARIPLYITGYVYHSLFIS